MTALALDYRYSYLHSSRLDPTGHSLQLATFSDGDDQHPYFFSGRLVQPKHTAEMLRGLMHVVRTRFHVPAAMLQRVLSLADPIVTCSDQRLRFEGFSSCCGVYVRIDLLPESVSGETFGRGTTNVDFNETMLAALATVRATDDVSISVGADRVEISKNFESIVEKKVKLPFRWLRGLVEVQACQSRMELVHQVSGIEARRFLRSLPRIKTNRRETFIVPAGKSGKRPWRTRTGDRHRDPRDRRRPVGQRQPKPHVEAFAAEWSDQARAVGKESGGGGAHLGGSCCRRTAGLAAMFRRHHGRVASRFRKTARSAQRAFHRPRAEHLVRTVP